MLLLGRAKPVRSDGRDAMHVTRGSHEQLLPPTKRGVGSSGDAPRSALAADSIIWWWDRPQAAPFNLASLSSAIPSCLPAEEEEEEHVIDYEEPYTRHFVFGRKILSTLSSFALITLTPSRSNDEVWQDLAAAIFQLVMG